ncbi:MAG: AP2 domain-containing protein [Methylococcales bacterium]
MNKINYDLRPNKSSLARRKTIHGVGVNDADYIVAQKIDGELVTCPFYRKWTNMLRRCYSQKIHVICPTYIGCTVVNEWLIFSVFKNWMERQDWENKELDKDLLVHGNKVYGPDTCLFVSREINLLLTDSGAIRGKYPQGVCWAKHAGAFVAQIKKYGKKHYLGLFDTPEKASETYQAAKQEHVRDIALKQTGILKTALLGRIK